MKATFYEDVYLTFSEFLTLIDFSELLSSKIKEKANFQKYYKSINVSKCKSRIQGIQDEVNERAEM